MPFLSNAASMAAVVFLSPVARTFVRITTLITFALSTSKRPVQIPIEPSSQALNPQLTNSIPIGPNGPILYYNGSGPVPPYNETSPIPDPVTPLNSTSLIEDRFFEEIVGIVDGANAMDNCTKCIMSTELMHLAAITQPVQTITNLLVRACEAIPSFRDTIGSRTCYDEFSGIGGLGSYWAQLFSKMSMATGDMEAFCHFKYEACHAPPTTKVEESYYFSPKPEAAEIAPDASGHSINVLHLSDWHMDPRYDIGSEANCIASNASVPASRFGYFFCDTPPDLAVSSFASMSQFFDLDNVSFGIFTGDIVTHDNPDQLSRSYVEYEETVAYKIFKSMMPNTPVYATLGNHDTIPAHYATQSVFNPRSNTSANAMSWNYDLLSSIWHDNAWLNSTESAFAAAHYGAYAHTTADGLRVISINTDFWYKNNVFNYWNFTNPDTSGVLAFLANELSACESRGQRAWVIGHVLSGYDGTDTLPNASALFYSIVRRFSPRTIAGIFFGHTHKDQFQIFYDFLPNSASVKNGKTYRDTTMIDYTKPLMTAFIGPSITPLTGYNSGYQLYQVDRSTFSVTGKQTYFANISNSHSWAAPVWEFEYDARDAYAPFYPAGPWQSRAPLNATFWHGITEAMLRDRDLVETYNLLETKSSALTKNCSTAACTRQKVCYLRSGSGALGRLCPKDHGPP